MKSIFLFFILLFSNIIVVFAQENTIYIETEKELIPFNVKIAKTPAQYEQGLMFRKKLPEKHGMLFLFHDTKKRYMWMKNTFIPLDMIFADNTGKIIHIFENAQPLDETIIPSQKPTAVVLELPAGTVQKENLKIGHKIKIPDSVRISF